MQNRQLSQPARTKLLAAFGWLGTVIASALLAESPPPSLQAKDIAVSGRLGEEKAQLTITANLLKNREEKERLLYTSQIKREIQAGPAMLRSRREITFRRIQGKFDIVTLGWSGKTWPTRVAGKGLKSWSIRSTDQAEELLVLEFEDPEAREDGDEAATETQPLAASITIETEIEIDQLPFDFSLHSLQFEFPTLSSGEIRLTLDPDLAVDIANAEGLIPVIPLEPETRRLAEPGTRQFRFHGTGYRAAGRIRPRDADALRVVMDNLKIEGKHNEHSLTFKVAAEAATQNPRGARRLLLGGQTAITDIALPDHCAVRLELEGYMLQLDRPGAYPIVFEFAAKITENNGWRKATFHLPAAALLPLQLSGFDAATEFHLADGGSIEATENGFHTFLPANGQATLAWRFQQEETSSKLFYNTESHAIIRIGTGVMRQTSATAVTVMQGELDRIKLHITGEGEITRVTATDILSWEAIPTDDPAIRELAIRFSQAQTKQCEISVSTLSTLGTFPLETQPIRITPQGATRHHGWIEVVNEGAVRLHIANTSGLSRVSPKNAAPRAENERRQAYPSQRFAFRHSSTEYALTAQVDDIQPEITASALIAYHLGHEQTRIEADLDLEIREAPIRDHVIRIPSDYVMAEVKSHGLADFFITPSENAEESEIRLEFEQPVFGRQQIQLRLEKNEALEGTLWKLGKVAPQATRQLRGHISISSIQGFRITPNTFSGVSEIATVYFPKQTEGLQAAFRITGADWNIHLNAAPIPQAVQADCTHLYTIGNGLIYGSSLIQFAISGAPVDAFQFDIPGEYQNVEFTGEEIRNWIETDAGYEVILQSPRIGPYTLLVSYERPFQDESDNLNASGAFPLNTTTERGTIILSSSRQIQLDLGDAPGQLIRLAPEELSPEHRLLLSQPVLAAFQYRQRPFNLNLGLSTLSEGSSVKQIVDHAVIKTRIAQDGQTVTTAQYYVKSTGSPHFQLTLPPDSRLWSARVDGQTVSTLDNNGNLLIPLGQNLGTANPTQVEISMAATAPQTANPVSVDLPQLTVPMLYSKWHLEAAPQQKLRYLEGNLIPGQSSGASNGFHQLQQLFSNRETWPPDILHKLAVAGVLLAVAAFVFHFSRQAQIRDFKWRRRIGIAIGAAALIASTVVILATAIQSLRQLTPPPGNLEFDLSLTLPGQTAYALIENRSADFLLSDALAYGWPLALAAILLGYSAVKLPAAYRDHAELGTWLLVFFGVLSWPQGGPLALLLAFAFLMRHFVFPTIRTAWQAQHLPASATALLAFLLLGHAPAAFGSEPAPEGKRPAVVPDRVEQQLKIEDGFVSGQAAIQWNARAGQAISLLREPGILTRIAFDAARAKLSETTAKPPVKTLIALQDGPQTVQFDYQIPVKQPADAPAEFELPTQYGLINHIQIDLEEPNAELIAPRAISIAPTRASDDHYSYWTIIPEPANGIRIQWQPRQRNRSEETPVYFAELTTLLIPSSGLIEGFQDIAIRPAQGEVAQIHLATPSKIAINDVWAQDLAQWRFEPENNRLKIDLIKPQAQPFLIRIRSQWIAGPLPYTAALAFPAVEDISGQVGTIGIATSNEAQIKELAPSGLTPIDPQDFPRKLLELCRAQFPDAGIRQAFRYSNPAAALELSVEPVTPHIAITTNERLSIGEDRTLLAATIDAQISRAGIFHLSFLLPAGMNIDSVSGNQLSHWTEIPGNNAQTVTLHLKQKSLGQQQFDLTLSGPGISLSETWTAPKIIIQESNRQRGQLLIIPEQGVRLQPTARDNVSPIDPQTRGVQTSGAQAFDLLNRNWNLAFRIEQVAPWIEVASLQDTLFAEGKIDIAHFLDFRIKNTAVKSLSFALPNNANNVRFEGNHIADAVFAPDPNTDRSQWTVRLQRRIIGNHRLALTYQTAAPETVTPFQLQGIIVNNANLQRSFLALRTKGRLQLALDQLPESLYPTDWHNIPRNLRRNLPDSLPIEHSFRAVQADFQLPLALSRRQIAQTLTAQVNRFDLTTIISQNGSILTQADIAISPGSKRSLEITLPPDSEFWFARVDGQTVSALDNNDNLLIPLGQNLGTANPTQVEIYLQAPPAQTTTRQLRAALKSPNLDLPADSITWTVYLDRQWKLADWDGDLQLIQTRAIPPRRSAELKDYLSQENTRRRHRVKEAEAFLQQGNQALRQGNEAQAQFAFQNAYHLTPHDDAFNEDARVQLKTLKTQQAMAGITIQQNKQSSTLANLLPADTNQQLSAKKVLEQTNPADENTLLNLANRLVEQQDEAAAAPRGFDITLPEQGQQLQFLKSVQVDSLNKITLRIQARSTSQSIPLPIAALLAAALTATYLLRKIRPRKNNKTNLPS